MTTEMAESNCPDRKLLDAFLSGTLPTEETDHIRTHLADCPICSETLHGLSGHGTTIAPHVERGISTLVSGGPLQAPAVATPLDVEPQADCLPPPVDDVEPPPPMLGPYRIEGLLGCGGMGNVYRATHANLGKVVALKILPPHQFSNPSLLDRFQREIKAVGRLDHPNLVCATDAGMSSGVCFLAMELVHGVDLNELVTSRGGLGVPEACELIRQAAVGLQHAHEAGLIHRDVKPSNLMLTEHGTVKVLDLGLALLADDPGSGLTSEGVVMGTVDYMAPEQASDSHSVDARTDVYSLGCTLYQLLCNRAPFSGPEYGTPIKRLMAHAHVHPQSVREIRSDVPEELDRLIGRMLAKEPADRPQTAVEIAEALARFARGANLAALLPIPPAADISIEPAHAHDDLATSAGQTAALEPSRRDLLPLPAKSASRPTWQIATGIITTALFIAGVIVIIRNRQGEEVGRFRAPKGGSVTITESEEADSEQTEDALSPTPETIRAPEARGTAPPAEEIPSPAFASLGTWEPSVADDVLRGLVPRPAKLPGISHWNMETVAPRNVWSLAYSPDGRSLAYGTGMQVHVIDITTKKLTHLFNLGKTYAGQICWSPDSRMLASATNGATVYQLWNVEENRPGPRLEHELGWQTGVYSVSFSPDSRYLVGGQGQDVLIWSADDGGLIAKLEGPARLTVVAWSPDGRRIASGGRDNVIRIWDAKEHAQVHAFSGHAEPIRDIAWHPHEQRLASCGSDGQVRIWSLEPPDEQGVVLPKDFEETSITDLEWSPDGKHLAAHVAYHGAVIWNAAGELERTIPVEFNESVGDSGWTRDSQHLVICTDRGIFRWRTSDGQLEERIGGAEPIRAVKWSPDGQWIAVGRDQTVFVFSVSGRLAAVCRGHDGPVNDLSWSPDSSFIASASGDRTLRIWDASTGNEHLRVSEHTGSVDAVAWNPHFAQLASGSADQTIRLWNPDNGELLRVIQSAGIQELAWSPDGRRLATAELRSAHIWNIAEPQPPLTLNGPRSRYFAVAWSPSGDQLATSSVEIARRDVDPKTKVQSWNARTGDPELVARGGAIAHQRLLAWNPVHPWIVSNVGYDTKLTDSRTGLTDNEAFIEFAHIFTAYDADWSPDGRYLAGGGSDNTVRVWDTANNAPVWHAVLLPSGESVSFTAAGELLESAAVSELDDDLIYYLEQDDGRTELLTPAEFHNRVAGVK